MMKASEGIYRSPLDKPLRELTEEDISQVTREDCRRYLKEKGMRRPSWNKSQAIQQVLSLKSLFETWPGKQESGSLKSPSIASGGPCPPDSAVEGAVNLSEGSRSGGEDRPPVQTDSESPAVVLETSTLQAPLFPVFCPRVADLHGDRSADGIGLWEPAGDVPRSSTKESATQMTIFYGGMVNVYDDVSTEKARFVMLLADSPDCMPHVTASPHTSAFPARRTRPPSPPPTTLPPPSASSPTDGPKTRKESVQRFLEKRKERYVFLPTSDQLRLLHETVSFFHYRFSNTRGRLKVGCGRLKSTSGLESYLTQQIRDCTRNTRSGTEDTCSPTNPVPPSTPSRSWSFRSQPVFSGDLNNDDGIGLLLRPPLFPVRKVLSISPLPLPPFPQTRTRLLNPDLCLVYQNPFTFAFGTLLIGTFFLCRCRVSGDRDVGTTRVSSGS
ncbi:TIFY 4B protein [Nymphaea thermarum]|nr:TIFY 4B protein [Nymphaea thermarum]